MHTTNITLLNHKRTTTRQTGMHHANGKARHRKTNTVCFLLYVEVSFKKKREGIHISSTQIFIEVVFTEL